MKRIPDEDLLDEISRLADGGSPPTMEEFRDRAKHDATTVQRRWETWNTALQEAGFIPNEEYNIPDEKLLNALQQDAQGGVAPRKGNTTYDSETYRQRFRSWWRACVQAGLRPHSHRPLTHTESQQFFEATVGQQKPRYQLIGLLGQFTGLPVRLVPKLSPDWLTTQAENTVVTVPASHTQSGETWTFKIPSTWTDAAGERRDTGLSGLLHWVLRQDSSIDFSKPSIPRTIYRIARDAGLHDRERVNRSVVGKAPLVRHSDLRATGGVQMARNGAPARRIRRHLGIDHTGWEADVEDFFLWLYVHEGYEHPEYDPPDIVLDPV